jgi:ferredoxin
MRIVVNWSRCDSNGLCTRQAPKLLAIDEHDQLHVLQEIFSEEERAAAERAVKVCPKAALSIADSGSESGGSQQ